MVVGFQSFGSSSSPDTKSSVSSRGSIGGGTTSTTKTSSYGTTSSKPATTTSSGGYVVTKADGSQVRRQEGQPDVVIRGPVTQKPLEGRGPVSQPKMPVRVLIPSERFPGYMQQVSTSEAISRGYTVNPVTKEATLAKPTTPSPTAQVGIVLAKPLAAPPIAGQNIVTGPSITYAQELAENTAMKINQQVFEGKQGVVVSGSGTDYTVKLNPEIAKNMDAATKSRFEQVIKNAMEGYQKTSAYGTFKQAPTGEFKVSQHTPSEFSYSSDTGELQVTYASGETMPVSKMTAEELKTYGPDIETAKTQILLKVSDKLAEMTGKPVTEQWGVSSPTAIHWEGSKLVNVPATVEVKQGYVARPITAADLWGEPKTKPISQAPAYQTSYEETTFIGTGTGGPVYKTMKYEGLGETFITAQGGIPKIEYVKFTGGPQPELVREGGVSFISAEKISTSYTGNEWTFAGIKGPKTIIEPSSGAEIPSTPFGVLMATDWTKTYPESWARAAEEQIGAKTTIGGIEIRPFSQAVWLTAGFGEMIGKAALGATYMAETGVEMGVRAITKTPLTQAESEVKQAEIAGTIMPVASIPFIYGSFAIGPALGAIGSKVLRFLPFGLGEAGTTKVLVSGATGKAIRGMPEEVAAASMKTAKPFIVPESRYVFGEGGVITEMTSTGKPGMVIQPPKFRALTITTATEAGEKTLAIPTPIPSDIGKATTYFLTGTKAIVGNIHPPLPTHEIEARTPALLVKSELGEGGTIIRTFTRTEPLPMGEVGRYVSEIGPPKIKAITITPAGATKPSIVIPTPIPSAIADIPYAIKYGMTAEMSHAAAYARALGSHLYLPAAPTIGSVGGAVATAGRIGAEGARWSLVTGGLATVFTALPAFATAYISPEASAYEMEAWKYERTPYPERGEGRMPPEIIAKVSYALGETGKALTTPEAAQTILGAAAGGFFLGMVAETQPLIVRPYRKEVQFAKAKAKPYLEEVPKLPGQLAETFIGKPAEFIVGKVFPEEGYKPMDITKWQAERTAYNKMISEMPEPKMFVEARAAEEEAAHIKSIVSGMKESKELRANLVEKTGRGWGYETREHPQGTLEFPLAEVLVPTKTPERWETKLAEQQQKEATHFKSVMTAMKEARKPEVVSPEILAGRERYWEITSKFQEQQAKYQQRPMEQIYKEEELQMSLKQKPQRTKTLERGIVREMVRPATRMATKEQYREAYRIAALNATRMAERSAIRNATKTATKEATKEAVRFSERMAIRSAERMSERTAERAAERMTERMAVRSATRMATRQATRTATRQAEREATRIVLLPKLGVMELKRIEQKKPKIQAVKSMHDVRSLYADLISVAETELIVGAGKALHPSMTKYPELWERERTGRIPTAQQLSGQVKSKSLTSAMFKNTNRGMFA